MLFYFLRGKPEEWLQDWGKSQLKFSRFLIANSAFSQIFRIHRLGKGYELDFGQYIKHFFFYKVIVFCMTAIGLLPTTCPLSDAANTESRHVGQVQGILTHNHLLKRAVSLPYPPYRHCQVHRFSIEKKKRDSYYFSPLYFI